MTEKKNSKEIDILLLFSRLTKKTNSLLVLIINFFISILNLFIKFLFIIKNNYILLSAAFIIGSIIGYIYEKKFYESSYKSTLTLSPNFGSTYKVYENIKFYQSLIDQEDFKKLSYQFGIDTSKAKSIKNISIEPFKTQSSKLSNYERLVNVADSVTALTLSYGKFEDKIPFDFYKFHIITLELNSKNVPIEIERIIIKSVENNTYFKNKKETFIENLMIKKKYILASIQKIDTLLFSENKRAKLLNEDKISGTTILLEKNQNQSIELKLFDRYTLLRDELVKVNNELNDKSNIINIISSFSKTSAPSSSEHRSVINAALISFLITLIIILFKILNTFLNQKSNFKVNKLSYKN